MAPLQSRRKAGVMPIGESTLACVVLKVPLEPAFLRRAKTATAHMRAVGIEGNQVPRADLIAVVPLPGRPRHGAEIREISGRVGRPIFVIPDRGVGDGLVAPPCGVIRPEEHADATTLVLGVSQGENAGRVS